MDFDPFLRSSASTPSFPSQESSGRSRLDCSERFVKHRHDEAVIGAIFVAESVDVAHDELQLRRTSSEHVDF